MWVPLCAALLAMSAVLEDGTAVQQADPVAAPNAIVTTGQARFTVLTPAMIRMEWSPDARFEDRASLVFINRRLPVPKYETRHEQGWLLIDTGELILRYKEDGGRFSPDNLNVHLNVGGNAAVWKPGAPDTGNLHGTTRTLDGVSGATTLEPGLLSRDGWTLVDDSQRPVFTDAKPAWVAPRPENDNVDWYFFGYGHDYLRALADFTRVAGRIPLPPRYVFGSWWSRYWSYTDQQLKALVGEFGEHDVPLDVLVIDMGWHLPGWTGFTWDPRYFPDPAAFLKWVDDHHLQTTLNLHPHDGVGDHEAAFRDFANAMGLDPDKTKRIPFDCTDPKFMSNYFKLLLHPKESMGVDFWWIDWQQGEQSRMPGLDPLWWLNRLQWTDMERNKDRGDKRPLIFSRWGGLGNHRYEIGFSGDTFSNWSSLAFQPYFTATAGNVCFDYWSHDIGGHQPGPVGPELYTRWVQFGAFSPVLRTHTTHREDAERRIWKFPQENFLAMREAFDLRYQLLPYIYTAARRCYDTAVPLCSPLYYEWPDIDAAYQHPDEYLFGPDLLVAPVVTPASRISDRAEVTVWLPPGTWGNWFSGRSWQGPREVSLLVALDEIPLFVRGGAVIPAAAKIHRARDAWTDPLVLHVFPGEEGRTRVYEDDGVSTGYLKHQCAWTPVSQTSGPDATEVVIEPTAGRFKGMERARTFEIHLHDTWPPKDVLVNGEAIKAGAPNKGDWWYDDGSLSIVIRVRRESPDEQIEVAVRKKLAESDAAVIQAGLRGRLALVRQIGRDVIKAAGASSEKAAVDAVERINTALSSHTLFRQKRPRDGQKLIDGSARGLMQLIPRLGLDETTERHALVQLLGLTARLRVKAAAPGEPELRVNGTLSVQPVMSELKDVTARVSLSDPANYAFDGKSEWQFDKLGDAPITFETTLSPSGRPQTSILRADVQIGAPHVQLHIPLDVVILPSINRWWIVGPFDAPDDDRLQQVFPPESTLDLSAEYEGKDGKTIKWQRVERQITADTEATDENYIEFHKIFGDYYLNAVAYALVYLQSPEERDVVLAIGSDDGEAVWLNDEEVYRHDVGRPYTPKEDRVPVHLRKGANKLLLKISQGGGMWGFSVHVEDEDGKPLPDVRATLEP